MKLDAQDSAYASSNSRSRVLLHLIAVDMLMNNKTRQQIELMVYRKAPKVWDTRKLCCNHLKTGKKRFYHRVMHPNDADSMASSEDPDQTAPLGAVRSGSALFVQTSLSENLGSLRY